MKYIKKILFILVISFLFIPFISADEKNDVTIYLFYSDSCPHCRKEKEFLSTLKDIEVKKYEVNENSDLVTKVRKELNINRAAVPLTIIGSDYVIGFSEELKNEILNLIDDYENKKHCDAVDLIIENKDIKECIDINNGIYIEREEKVISLFGKNIEFNAKNVSLPLISMLIGFIDGFNPCAMWVLIFLISMLFNMKNKKRMWILGLTFLITSALVYLLFMTGILSIANSTGTYFKYIIAIVALIGGIVNLNSFRKSLNKDAGCQVTNKKQRKKIIERIKNILGEKHFIISIVGIMLLAVSVNIVELACSAGLPTIFIEILSLNNLSNLEYSLYMTLYILMFMIDDIVIFIIAMTTLKITGISNKYTKYSHLVGGIIMIIIGILMVFKTDWLMFNF